jgi:hypothetical protein
LGLAFYFQEPTIARRNSTTSIFKHAKKSVDITGNGLAKLTNAHQPFVSRNSHFMADRISHEINIAILLYKQRRYDVPRASLLIDISKLVLDLIWAFIGPLLYALAMTVVYIVVSLSVFGVIFYLIFIL